MARVQAARGFFSSGRASGCRAGHPAAVLQGLLLPLQQLPSDLSQGQPCYQHVAGDLIAAHLQIVKQVTELWQQPLHASYGTNASSCSQILKGKHSMRWHGMLRSQFNHVVFNGLCHETYKSAMYTS